MTINEDSEEIICTAFGKGSTHDFQVFKASKMILAKSIECLADRGYQGLDNVHANSRTPVKKSNIIRSRQSRKLPTANWLAGVFSLNM